MKEFFLNSIQMIKNCNIKSEKEYFNLLKEDYYILSPESLKYICNTRDFKKIIKTANTFEKGS